MISLTIALNDTRVQPLRPILHLIKLRDMTLLQMTGKGVTEHVSKKEIRIEMLQRRLDDPLTRNAIKSRNPSARAMREQLAHTNPQPPGPGDRVSVKQCG
jgi:hypothetical protein